MIQRTDCYSLQTTMKLLSVMAGFSSGYLGTGPRGLSVTLSLLERHNVEINEFIASHMIMERLERSCLLNSDVVAIKSRPPIIPCRWCEYIIDSHDDDLISKYYPHSIPFALIDQRIIDLAINFRDNEDASLMSAYRRLEDAIRKRTGIQGEGNKLFSKAFVVDNCPLTWNVPDPGEAKGRGQLFTAAFSAFRNARAHRENEDEKETQLREFLLINELFRLERESLTADELRNAKDDISAAAEFIKSSRK